MTRTLERPVIEDVGLEYPDEIAVVVTQAHIRDGRRRQGERCAMALAFHDAGYPNVSVTDEGRVWIRTLPHGGQYECEPAEAWVQKFDADREVHPERFVWRRINYP